MKPRTKQELAQLTKMNPGSFYITEEEAVKLNNICKETGISFPELDKFVKNLNRKSLFEIFYDYMSNLINWNKSIAPAELKGF